MKIKSRLFKALSIVVCICFFHQQLLWALDYPFALPSANDNNSSGMLSSQQLGQAQARQEELIAMRQDIEDFQSQAGGADSAITTSTDYTLHYNGETLNFVELPDDTLLTNIAENGSGALSNAIIRYADGSALIIEEGRQKTLVRADGSVVHYDGQGLIEEEIAPDGIVSSYYYFTGATGEALKTVVTRYDAICEYNSENRLTKVTKQDGAITEYENGLIARMASADGSVYTYSTASEEIDGQEYLVVTPLNVTNPAGFNRLVYTQDYQLVKAEQEDGTILTFENGLITSVTTLDGNVINYNYALSESGSILNVNIEKDGVEREYELYGNLSQLGQSDLVLGIGASGISRIEKTDGTIIENATFDSQNNIIDATVTRPDGAVALYQGGVLCHLTLPDGSNFTFSDDGRVAGQANPDGLIYNYSYIEEGGQAYTIAQAVNAGASGEAGEIIYIKYDSANRIALLRRSDGLELTYSYICDEGGNATGTIVDDGGSKTHYDADNNIEKTEVAGTADDPEAVISIYQYNRIRQVTKGGELLYNYTYEFDAEGNETTVIEDVKTGEAKRYRDELLMNITDASAVVTSYEYDAERRLLKSTVSRSGKLINAYAYTYDGELTVIESLDGARRAYDADNKLLSLEENGRTYAYSYWYDEEGAEFVHQDLVKAIDSNGTVINYANQDIESIVKTDGTVIKDIIVENGQVTSFTAEKGGLNYFVENGEITKITDGQGNIIETDKDGCVTSVVTPAGETINYIYGITGEQLPDLTDSVSNSGYPVTLHGDAAVDANNSKFGDSSVRLDGHGDYLSFADSDNWNFGAGDFTIDMWVKLNEFSPCTCLFSQETDGMNLAWCIIERYDDTTGAIKFEALSANTKIISMRSSDIQLTSDAWYHIALVRNGAAWNIYKNGVSVASTTDSDVMPNFTRTFQIGIYSGDTAGVNFGLNGWVDEAHITKGEARWTANFTPPAQKLESITVVKDGSEYLYTKDGDLADIPDTYKLGLADNIALDNMEIINNSELRLQSCANSSNMLYTHLDGANYATSAPDNSGLNQVIAFNGNARIDTAQSQTGGSSVLLDGRGDYLSFADSDSWNFGAGSFTIDTWVRFNGFNPCTSLFSQETDGMNMAWCIIERYDDTTGAIKFEVYSANKKIISMRSSDIQLASDTWYHIALVRNGNNWNIYKDGVSVASTTNSDAMPDFTRTFQVGIYSGDTAGVNFGLNGWVDEVRISKGQGSYYQSYGTMTSNPALVNAAGFDSLTVNTSAPAGTSIRIQTRTGASLDENDGTWGGWVDAAAASTGYTINSAPNKYIQCKAILETANPQATPSIILSGGSFITVNYTRSQEARGEPAPEGYELPGTLHIYIPDTTDLDDLNSDAAKYAGDDDTFVETISYTAELLEGLTLPDGTQIKYFNNKPISITMAAGASIDNIVVEKYNAAVSDYKIENGALVQYTDTGRADLILSFTAVNAAGDTYVFKSDTLSEIRGANGAIISNPALDSFAASALALLKSAFDPDSLGGETHLESADISLGISSDGKLTYFINGKIACAYYKYDDGRLELLSDYVYDEAGNLILVRLPYARDSIEAQMAAARQKISEEKTNYLRQLVEQKNLAYQQIRDQIQSVRDQISAERQRLLPMLYQEVTCYAKRWYGYKKYTETIKIAEVDNALKQLDEQDKLLNDQEAASYAQLDSEVAAAGVSLTQDEASSLAEIARQEEIFHCKITEEESLPIILDCYRSILGRDPDQTEKDYWLSKVSYNSKVNVNELKQELLNSQERFDQQALVDRLKSEVVSFLNSYINAGDAEKEAILSGLGLSLTDTVKLDEAEVGRIIEFLNKQNIHFGKSAFVALGSLLAEKNIPYDFEQVAFRAILVDILVGAINGVSDGSVLEISMFSLSKVASLYGLELYNTHLEYEDLTEVYNRGGTCIVHLKNNHFVVVTGIGEDGSVTYREANEGSAGQIHTVSKEQFLESWTGYAITQIPPADNSKIISAEEAQRIKGSCLPFLGILIGLFIQSLAAVAVGVISTIAAIVTAVSAIVGPIIAAVGNLIAGVVNIMMGLGAQIFSAVKFVGISLFKGLGILFGGGAIGGAAAGTATASTGFSFGALGMAIGKTVVTTALSLGISKGLTSLGVNPVISNLLSSFVTGGVSGLFNNFTPIGFMTGALQGLAIQGTSTIGNYLGIDPALSGIVGMTAGSIIGAGLNGLTQANGTTLTGLPAIAEAMNTTIKANVASELAYYGVTQLGEEIGLDSRISSLAGMGIRSAINVGLTPEQTPADMWNGIQNGLIRGATSIGLQWTAQELDIDPFIASLSSTAIAGSLEAFLEGQSPLKGVYDAYFKAGTGLLTLGGDGGSNPWLQSAYLAQVIDFSRIVEEQGIGKAIESYATGFLHQTTINEIWKQGGIYDLISKNAEITVNSENQTVKRVWINKTDKAHSGYLDLDLNTDNMRGYKQVFADGSYEVADCDYVVGPDKKTQAKNEIKTRYRADGSIVIQQVTEDFKLVRITEYTKDGMLKDEIIALAGKSIQINEQGVITSGVRKNHLMGSTTIYDDGHMTYLNIERSYTPTLEEVNALLDKGYTMEDIANFKEHFIYDSSELTHKTQIIIRDKDNKPIMVSPQELVLMDEKGRKIWETAVKLASDIKPQTTITLDKSTGVAKVDMALSYLSDPNKAIDSTDPITMMALEIAGYAIGNQNANWTVAVQDAVGPLGAILANEDAKFVFVPGVNTAGPTLEELTTLKNSLQTDKTVVVGHSAGTEVAIREMFTSAKADKYLLLSPRMSPASLRAIMAETGVSPDQVVVVTAKGDFPNHPFSYIDGGGTYWTSVHIEDGPGVSANPLESHSVMVNGWLNGSVYKEIIVNGEIHRDTTLSEIYKIEVNK